MVAAITCNKAKEFVNHLALSKGVYYTKTIKFGLITFVPNF